MADHIEREALIKKLRIMPIPKQAGRANTWLDNCAAGVNAAIREVASFPAADVAPVVHGRWDDSGRYTFPSGSTAVRCTNCGCALTESEYRLNNWNYCPVCGAKMDGGADNDTN